MFSSRAHDETSTATGFAVPHGRLLSFNFDRRLDEMLIFYVVAVALLAAIVIPAWQASQVTPVIDRKIGETVQLAAKGDRLHRPEVDLACSGVTYGNESGECLVAIAKDSGREMPAVRVVGVAVAING